MINLTAKQILKLVEGTPSINFDSDLHVNQVSMDSRKVTDNFIFIALYGEKNDSHKYVADLVKNKTNLAIVDQNFAEDLPNLIRVENTTLALGVLAKNYRQLFTLPVVAITGSNGKTSVKEMLRIVCENHFGKGNVLATSGNLNNHWGMPLTLLELSHLHKVAIIEMGMNHSGEINYLTNIAKPTLAVVNNVMFAHAGHFNTLDDIADAKAEIYLGLNDSAIACVDISSSYANKYIENSKNAQIFTYGSSNSSCYIVEISEGSAIYQTPFGKLDIKLGILGKHNYYNALTVITLAINLGCSLKNIKLGLEAYTGYKGRLEQKKAFNGSLIIDDTYNANPDSVKAALEAISNLPRPHWFIFGDLKELGEREAWFHQQIGEFANKSKIDMLITVGELAKYASNFFNGSKMHFESNDDVVKYCISYLPSLATILIKGSNSMRLSEVVDSLVFN